MDDKEAEKKRSLRNEKLKANRTLETEEQRKERLRIRRENESEKENCGDPPQELAGGNPASYDVVTCHKNSVGGSPASLKL